MSLRLAEPGVTTLLDGPPLERLGACAHLRGFDGVHGGLTLALLARRMLADSPGHELVSLEGRFVRTMLRGARLDSAVVKRGRTAVWSTAVAQDADGPVVTAAGLLRPRGSDLGDLRAPAVPCASHPEGLPELRLPPAFAAVLDQVEIRNAGSTRPFGGHETAELLAWVRIIGDDQPLDALRTVFMVDVLVPSLTATLTERAAVPSLELSVHLGRIPPVASSWLLLHARTTRIAGDAWVTEDVDAWTREGVHVATARQLRLVLEV
ncbi:thioesterase family protein [Nocardioides marmorisolisilvae]|uniref:Thioesterase family protein n=1 Tax=Nocardioides marmorisolisilvae TaxID=1542737 RepID=A0A3N0DTB2_9ACTN|nr:thioesterase family protein [Nocardioides marmorisolisilvae]RNL78830.1 thioesterase family protein [Nocardioides marmorisolisilvae]